MQKLRASWVPAIVLGANGTGLATARCLADEGVQVHLASLHTDDIGRYSNCAQLLRLDGLGGDENAVIQSLVEYAGQIAERPVVLPTGDETALMLARHRDRLEPMCRLWKNSYQDLSDIVCKKQLYETAQAAGLPIPPMLIEPDVETLRQWCAEVPPPYFIKPYYSGIKSAPLKEKNRLFDDVRSLLEYARVNGMCSLIAQQHMGDGDGSIYDCYGLCLEDSSPHSMASHKRIRHYPPGRGATSYGKIPGFSDKDEEAEMFAQTRKLIGQVTFQGIFGIEWMRNERDGKLYLIDFNARPFSSIGHLHDCGVNLPWLSYLELIGNLPADIPLFPEVEHKYWIDLVNDNRSFVELHREGRLSWKVWLSDVMQARASAYWRSNDPIPCLMRIRQWLQITFRHMKKHGTLKL